MRINVNQTDYEVSPPLGGGLIGPNGRVDFRHTATGEVLVTVNETDDRGGSKVALVTVALSADSARAFVRLLGREIRAVERYG